MKASTLLLFAFSFLFAIDAFAQVSRGVSAAGRRNDDFDNQRTKAQRDAMAREMRPRKPSKEELQKAARIKAETKEDLEGLQQSYNEIVLRLNEGGDIPADFVAVCANKFHKYASRLKANTEFPEPNESDSAEPLAIPSNSRMRLHQLVAYVYAFLTNPIIENPAVLELDAAQSARVSLESIIALSESLR